MATHGWCWAAAPQFSEGGRLPFCSGCRGRGMVPFSGEGHGSQTDKGRFLPGTRLLPGMVTAWSEGCAGLLAAAGGQGLTRAQAPFPQGWEARVVSVATLCQAACGIAPTPGWSETWLMPHGCIPWWILVPLTTLEDPPGYEGGSLSLLDLQCLPGDCRPGSSSLCGCPRPPCPTHGPLP